MSRAKGGIMPRKHLITIIVFFFSIALMPPTFAADGVEGTSKMNPSWKGKSDADLIALVKADVKAKLKKYYPAFKCDQFEAYAADPNLLPLIPDRAMEQLETLGYLFQIEGKAERADQMVTIMRARANNPNKFLFAPKLRAEARRVLAGDSKPKQVAALVAAFKELPKGRFNGQMAYYLTTTKRLVELAGKMDRESLLTPMTAFEYLKDTRFRGAVADNMKTYERAFAQLKPYYARQRDPKKYAFQNVDIAGKKAWPVGVGIWDCGVDTTQFEDRLLVNTGEIKNGRDDDGNGQIDDIYGLAHDTADPDQASINDRLLYDPGEAVIAQYGQFLKGIMDIRAGMSNTPEARHLITTYKAVKTVDARRAFLLNLDMIGEWAHGTHVAGIAAKGNPFIRIAPFRSAWAGEGRIYHERGPTDAELKAEMQNAKAIAAFINRHGIRVVNASLGFDRDYVLEAILKEGTYTDPKKAERRADKVQAWRRKVWSYVFDHCPDTLFLVSAGNDNKDVVEFETVSSGIERPNVAAIGAVDPFGRWARFTSSNRKLVKLFDWGVTVPSIIPGGKTVPLSGTSMASPNATNTAAKLFALDPKLTPVEVKQILWKTGDPIPAPFYGRIIDQRRAIDAVVNDK